ncbi:3-oxoacyl-[acyl-carrier protein] reductase [Cryobacterium flavum]|uniref:3-oxoacyl-[acyl-carrier protein] reductase n=1 Tax=Cryobacterium flavum TaxID=1424659 RepID=A0A4R8VGD3_9MICO|nr:SDR family oxidoreductase [Cryobacterium flavum]TFB82311.1 SDR family oxidoreductase [Cryobacterium flavum]SDN96695.1 3-oxoacyl-[acyl-carrier protein] reductase [Cryobacterium flavum]
MTAPRKRALITGAARNIGRATALALARQGFDIVVHTRRDEEGALEVARQIERLGVHAEVVLADLADADAVQRVIGEIGRVDVLVNNAAIRPRRPFLEVVPAEWREVFAVNVEAPVALCQAFIPGMQAAGWGRIVSMTGVRSQVGAAGRASSSAAKHALVGLTRSLAQEFGRDGITVNAVCPGTIITDRDEPDSARMIERAGVGVLGRFGQPDDIAAVVGFLVSEAGGYVTGQTWGANGGELMS